MPRIVTKKRPNSLTEMRKLLESMKTDNRTLSRRIEELEDRQEAIKYIVKDAISEALVAMPRPDPLKHEILTKFSRNKREIIKNKILNLIVEKDLSVPELKDTIVDQHGYCSKATFYRYLEDMENLIDYIEINGRKIAVLKRNA